MAVVWRRIVQESTNLPCISVMMKIAFWRQNIRCQNIRSKSTFLRHMIVYGAVYDVDYVYLREYNYLLGKIGGNLNQIAKWVNETRSIYQTDMDVVNQRYIAKK